MHFLDTSRHLDFRATVIDARRAAAQTKSAADGIHGCVAASDDDDITVAERIKWLVELGETIRSHEVHTSKKLVGRVDAVEVLTRNIQEARQASARGDEDGIKTFFGHQLIDG